MIKLGCALLFLLASLAARSATAADMAQQARQLLARFRVEQDVGALSQAIELTGKLPKQQSKQQRVLWHAIISAINTEIRPEDDADNFPQLNLAPPPETGLPAGVAPDSIKDPALRQAYERAVEENKLKSERAHYQHALHLAEERAKDLMSESGQR